VTVVQQLEHATQIPAVIWSSLLAAAVLLTAGVGIRSRLGAAGGGGVVPDRGLSVRNAFEIVTEMLVGFAEQTMGHQWRTYFPFIATLFSFILIANLIGLVPGIGGATSNANTTWAWALISFAVHQYVGVRAHGWWYINHFLGPVMYDLRVGGHVFHLRLLAPIYAPIELISHLSRVFTLAVRLLANMFADHTVVAIWITLVPVLVPAIFMGLGVLVAFLQAYVFAMLSMIYIGLALEESH
jgi:F-type H+-transporting ATPase subunit a